MHSFQRLPQRLHGLRHVLPGMMVALALSACTSSMVGGTSAKKAMNEIGWKYAEDAIQLEVVADAQLNLFNDEPHTLVLAVLQVTSLDDFRKLSSTPQLLNQLLAGQEAQAPIVQVSRFIVSPGQKALLSLPRVADVKGVAIVAGYYRSDVRSSARLFEVPVGLDRKGIVVANYQAVPQPLSLLVELGPYSMVKAQPQAPRDAKAARPPRFLKPLDGTGREIPLSDEPELSAPLLLKP